MGGRGVPSIERVTPGGLAVGCREGAPVTEYPRPGDGHLVREARRPWHVDGFARVAHLVGDHTVAAYSSDVRGFAEWGAHGGVTEPTAVHPTTIRRYLAFLTTRHYARRSIARKTASLRRYFRMAGARRDVSPYPRSGCTHRRGRAACHGCSTARSRRAARRANARRRGVLAAPHGRAVLELLYGSGLRVSELCGLDVGSFDLDLAAVIVWGKGSKQRQVPLSAPSVAAARAWLAVRHEVVSPDASRPRCCSATSGARLARDVRRILDRRSPSPPILTPCATASPPICSTGVPTSGRCRNCSATPTSPPRSATPTSATTGCVRPPTCAPAGMSIVDVDPYLTVQWDRSLKRRSSSARDHLIVSYSPLVKFIAGRLGAGLPSTVDPADLVSSGVLGLIDALERFDPGQGVKFETFATPRIRGAIYDGLRQLDWVPRSVRARARDIERAMATRGAPLALAERRRVGGSARHHAGPARHWLSSVASTTVGPLERALDPGAEPTTLSGEVPIVRSRWSRSRWSGLRFRAEIGKLPDREKLVLSLYYDDGLTLAQIARVIGVSESHVPQLHSKSVLHLRTRLTAAGLA